MNQERKVIGKIEGMEFTTSIGTKVFVGTSNLDGGVFVQTVSKCGCVLRFELSREGAACLGKLLSGETEGATPVEIQHEHVTEEPVFEWQLMPENTEGFVRKESPKHHDPRRPWRNIVRDKTDDAALAT